MALSALALVCIAALAAALLYLVSALQAAARLRPFPGPPLATFSYLWMIRNTYGGQSADRYYRDAILRYGDVVRIGPRELLTSNPDIVRRLSATRTAAHQYHRSSWYALNRLDPYEDSMFSLRDDAAHDGLKARLAPGYAGRENPALESDVDAVLRQLVHVLRTSARTTSQTTVPPPRPNSTNNSPSPPPAPPPPAAPAADLALLAQYFTLDTITRIAFGRPFGFLTRLHDVHGYLQCLRDMAPTMLVCAEVPFLARLTSHPLFLHWAGPKHTDKRGVGTFMALARDIVGERFDADGALKPGHKDRPDMLGAFIRNGLTQRQCETEALFQIIAGSDTTATAIRMILLHVITSPRVYHRLQAEVDAFSAEADQVYHQSTASASSDDDPVFPHSVASNMPYLQACIWEGLRIHPPFVGLPFKDVPPQGDTIAGHFVPPGTRVAPSVWALMRRPDIFGDDVDVYRPERWLVAEKSEKSEKSDAAALDPREMRRTVELVFGYGRWVCAGKAIAFLEMNKAIPELLRQFDFQIINPLGAVTSICYNLFMQSDIWTRVTERNPVVATDHEHKET